MKTPTLEKSAFCLGEDIWEGGVALVISGVGEGSMDGTALDGRWGGEHSFVAISNTGAFYSRQLVRFSHLNGRYVQALNTLHPSSWLFQHRWKDREMGVS